MMDQMVGLFDPAMDENNAMPDILPPEVGNFFVFSVFITMIIIWSIFIARFHFKLHNIPCIGVEYGYIYWITHF